MKLIKPSFEIIPQEDLFQHIEKCGRVAYKSEDKITPDSAEKFVNMLIKSGHYSPLEHGTVRFVVREKKNANEDVILKRFLQIPYVKDKRFYVPEGNEIWHFITTNYRTILEEKVYNARYTHDAEEFSKRITVKFILSRAAAQQFTRHRKFSFTMESQRYCNYSKDKFGNEITFIVPTWIDRNREPNLDYEEEWLEATRMLEYYYFNFLKKGLTPQQARAILPNCTKTELVMTGFIEDWQHFFDERCSFLAKTGKPDDEAAYLADGLYEEFKNRNLL